VRLDRKMAMGIADSLKGFISEAPAGDMPTGTLGATTGDGAKPIALEDDDVAKFLTPLFENHYKSLQEQLEPFVKRHLETCEDCTHIGLLDDIQGQLKSSLRQVEDTFGRLPVEAREQRTVEWMGSFERQMKQAQSMIHDVKGRVDSVNNELKDVMTAQQADILGFLKEDLSASVGQLLADSQSAREHLAETFASYSLHVQEQLKPLVEASVHLAGVPQQGQTIIEMITSLTGQVAHLELEMQARHHES